MVECPVCFEEEKKETQHVFYAIQACGHKACKSCLIHWFEACENTGQTALPTCPKCRIHVSERDVFGILGRPFQPRLPRDEAEAATAATTEDSMDDLTRQFLTEYARVCGGCCTYVMKLDGCDLMQCLCGYRFCWHCGQPGRDCGCSPAHHYYWDNIVDSTVKYDEAPIATPEDLEDLPSFMATHREFVRREQAEEVSRWRKGGVLHYLQKFANDPSKNEKWMRIAAAMYRDQYLNRYPSLTAPSWAQEITPFVKHLNPNELTEKFPGVVVGAGTSLTSSETTELGSGGNEQNQNVET